MTTAEKLYHQFFVSNDFDRIDLFELLTKSYKIQRALYPGSFVHITPSFFIPSVTYVDSDRRCPSFFADPAIRRMVQNRKCYDENTEIVFHHGDYFKPIDEETDSYDLLISQWAGPISQACKRYLKVGGILLVNNSHGDASIASLDQDYQFAATITKRNGKYRINQNNSEGYFVPKSGKVITTREIESLSRGIAYTKSAAMYIFKRVQ
ncbi:MAG: class I SAM-dependent methyltransferase [Dehalogenimonas sp.]